MQIEKKDYNPEEHDIHRALCVKQPYAEYLTKPQWIDEEGNYHAAKEIEVRSRNTTYRGDLLICSSQKPLMPPYESGVLCGIVELYDVKPVAEFTERDWLLTCIPEKDRPNTGYGWLVRNPRKIVPFPVKGQLGIYNIIIPKGDLIEYPRTIKIGEKGWEKIKEMLK